MKTLERSKNVIKRSASYYRPYLVNGYEIDKVYVYNDGKVIYKSQSAWLEHEGRDVTEICGIHEVKRKNKVKLDGSNFVIKSQGTCITSKGRYDLYICAVVDNLGEYLKRDYELDKMYAVKYKIYLTGVVNKSYLDKEKELKYKDEIIPFIMADGRYRWVDKEEGVKVKRTQDIFKEFGMKDVSRYDMSEFLKQYDVVKK